MPPMARLPAVNGPYVAVISLALYSLFASSRHVKVTTSSTVAILSYSVIAGSPVAAGTALWNARRAPEATPPEGESGTGEQRGL